MNMADFQSSRAALSHDLLRNEVFLLMGLQRNREVLEGSEPVENRAKKLAALSMQAIGSASASFLRAARCWLLGVGDIKGARVEFERLATEAMQIENHRVGRRFPKLEGLMRQLGQADDIMREMNRVMELDTAEQEIRLRRFWEAAVSLNDILRIWQGSSRAGVWVEQI